ncbi:MAG: oligosaccharide flippase family protein [Geodermatophilaceae bacterium]
MTSLFYLLMGVVIAATMGFGSTTAAVILIVVGSALLRPFNVVDAWFKMELQSRVAVLIRMSALLITGAARVALPLLGFSVVAVAWTYVVEAALAGVGLWVGYRRMSGSERWTLESRRVGATLKELMPLLVTSSSALIYLRLDQAMVGWLSSLSEAGLFAIASSMAEAPRFALLALFISVAPRLLKLKNSDPDRYRTELIAVTRVLVLLGYLLTLALIFIMAPLAPMRARAGLRGHQPDHCPACALDAVRLYRWGPPVRDQLGSALPRGNRPQHYRRASQHRPELSAAAPVRRGRCGDLQLLRISVGLLPRSADGASDPCFLLDGAARPRAGGDHSDDHGAT